MSVDIERKVVLETVKVLPVKDRIPGETYSTRTVVTEWDDGFVVLEQTEEGHGAETRSGRVWLSPEDVRSLIYALGGSC